MTTGGDEEDRTAARASAVAGCAIVYSVQIGGPAAAKLVARRIHPLKMGVEVPIADLVSKLQEAGAVMLDDNLGRGSGDRLILLRDPWGVVIQLVKRKTPIIDS